MTHQQRLHVERVTSSERLELERRREANSTHIHIFGGRALCATFDFSDRRSSVSILDNAALDALISEAIEAKRALRAATHDEPCPATERNDVIRGAT